MTDCGVCGDPAEVWVVTPGVSLGACWEHARDVLVAVEDAASTAAAARHPSVWVERARQELEAAAARHLRVVREQW